MELNNTEMKMQYILDESKNLAEIPLTDMRPVEHPIKYKLVSAFEVFVRVPGTENYWISNYGRGVNNYRNSDKNKFYEHKQGQCHYTVYAISRTPEKIRGKLTGEIIVETTKRETCPEELVAKSFLKQYKGRFKVWHKNGDFADNWYKNLIYVTGEDFRNLKAGKITWQELGYEQEYIEYVNNAKNQAMTAYGVLFLVDVKVKITVRVRTSVMMMLNCVKNGKMIRSYLSRDTWSYIMKYQANQWL